MEVKSKHFPAICFDEKFWRKLARFLLPWASRSRISGKAGKNWIKSRTEGVRLSGLNVTPPCRSSTTVDSLITHTFRWTAQGMGFQGVWTSRRGQTKAKQIKYYLKIQKKNQKTDTPCCCYWNCLSVPRWAWRASVWGWISSFLIATVNQWWHTKFSQV